MKRPRWDRQLAYPGNIRKFHGAGGFLGGPTSTSPLENQPQAEGVQLSERAEERQQEGPIVIHLGRGHLDTCHPENSNREPTKPTEWWLAGKEITHSESWLTEEDLEDD